MRETVEVKGVVLAAYRQGELDKRLVVLTRERGKITVFANGVRKPNNPNMAAANPFVFAVFRLYEGRSAYTLVSADVVNYFTELAGRMPAVWYGFYFLDLASYYGREGEEAAGMVDLLYLTLRALMRGVVAEMHIRRVYELRIMVLNGEFALPDDRSGLEPAAREAILFAVSVPLTRIYAFSLSPKVEEQFSSYIHHEARRVFDRPFRSLEILDELAKS